MFWFDFSGIFEVDISTKNMEDSQKITQKVTELNSLNTGDDWTVLEGNQALTKVEGNLSGGSELKFLPATGIVIKTFMNRRNGEIKIFPAIMFEQNV